MADPTTVPTAKSVFAFIEAIESDAKRADAKTIDAMFRRVTAQQPKMWGASIIGYGLYATTYASGRDVQWLRAGFSPRRARHSLYLMGGYCDALTGKRRDAQLARLGKYSRGKSCLYFNKLADVNKAALEEMLADDWATMQRLYPE